MILDPLWQVAEMAQWVNVPVAKPGEFPPESHIVEGEN